MYPIETQIKSQITYNNQDQQGEFQFNKKHTEQYIRHFGTLINLQGDTTPTGKNTLKGIHTPQTNQQEEHQHVNQQGTPLCINTISKHI
jgi:hypothetical protein